uniref:Uncharacterized protein n=1 Tax=Kalanchoe fedtschenkoi TaxID=63787 RepID=A0A7N0VA59_KALFE
MKWPSLRLYIAATSYHCNHSNSLISTQFISYITNCFMANSPRLFWLVIALIFLSFTECQSRPLAETTVQAAPAAALGGHLGQLFDEPGPTGSPVELSKRVSPTGPDPHHH